MSLTRIEQKLDGFKAQTESSAGSVTNLSNAAKGLSKTLIAIGTTGVAALTGLASVAPAVAPALAKMQIGLMTISHTLGRRLQPLFESVANNLIPAIGDAIERFSPQIEKFAQNAAGGIEAVSLALANWDVSKLITFSAFGLAGAAAGFAIGGWGGAWIGLALGTALGAGTLSNINKFQQGGKFNMGEVSSALDKLEQFPVPEGYDPINKGLVTGTAGLLNSLQDLLEKILGRASDKQLAFTSKNGIG